MAVQLHTKPGSLAEYSQEAPFLQGEERHLSGPEIKVIRGHQGTLGVNKCHKRSLEIIKGQKVIWGHTMSFEVNKVH